MSDIPDPVARGCPDDAAAWVLHALDDGEAQAFAAHLAACELCRDDVAALQAVANVLPGSVPAVAPPRALRDRLMTTVRSEAELLAAAGRDADRPPSKWRWPRLVLRVRPLYAAAAASALLAIAGAGGFLARGGGAPTEQRWAGHASGAVLAEVRRSGRHLELHLQNMSPPGAGRVYQVWLERAGRKIPTDALFTCNSAGMATVAVPGDVRGVEHVYVTNEPQGGSLHPTTTPIVDAKPTLD